MTIFLGEVTFLVATGNPNQNVCGLTVLVPSQKSRLLDNGWKKCGFGKISSENYCLTIFCSVLLLWRFGWVFPLKLACTTLMVHGQTQNNQWHRRPSMLPPTHFPVHPLNHEVQFSFMLNFSRRNHAEPSFCRGRHLSCKITLCFFHFRESKQYVYIYNIYIYKFK